MPSDGGFGNLDITKNVLLPSLGSFNNCNFGGGNNVIMPSVGHFCDYNITFSFVGFHASYIFLSIVDFHTSYIYFVICRLSCQLNILGICKPLHYILIQIIFIYLHLKVQFL